MVGLLFLQDIFKLSDESIVELWKESPYYQYFTGEASLARHQPCVASELVYFRKRIGQQGVQMLLKTTLALHENTIKS